MTTFLGFPEAGAGAMADLVVLGVPHGVSYPDPGLTAGCAEAPAAIRRRSQRLAKFVTHHDFEMDGPMIPAGSTFAVADGGDIAGSPEDPAGNAARAEVAVRQVLAAGAVPLVLGGDDSIPIPVVRAFADAGPLTIVQVDAHLDYRDEVGGVREGYSSAIRRICEMPHVDRAVQVGLRGIGSARPSDLADARAAGNLLVTARELRERGVAWLLDQLPADASVFLVFDVDGLDPSVASAVSGLSPGGLSYDEACDLVTGLAARCRVRGAAFTELVPGLDPSGASALVVVRLAMQLIGALARK